MPRLLIYSTAFIFGFVLMSFEILGSRLLAPYFGRSVYIWGALISVLLAALAAGNFYGGKLADRVAPRRLLRIITLTTALYFLISPWYARLICNLITEYITGLRSGLIICALLIFWLPAICLGATTPILAKLLITKLSHLAGDSGRLLSIAAAGNICGTLITAFFLIGRLPTGITLQLLALPLLLILFLCRRQTAKQPM